MIHDDPTPCFGRSDLFDATDLRRHLGRAATQDPDERCRMSPEDQRHGTHAGHVAGCRDQCCRDAAARYERGRQWDLINGRTRTVPTIGARRRINALQAIGWSAEYLSMRLGFSRAWLNMTVNHNRSGVMYRRNFELIDTLYRELCMTPGPSTVTAHRAAARGWAPPLAWDDIDDPNETPVLGGADDQIDPVVVDRLVAGIRLPSTRAEKVEAMRRWVAAGRSQASLCAIHGWQQGRYVEREDGAA